MEDSEATKNLKVISADMPEEMQNDILKIVLDARKRFDKEKDQAKAIKQALDTKYERLWHVVIVIGQYWNYISHEPEFCFNFKLGRHIFMLWRTPGY